MATDDFWYPDKEFLLEVHKTVANEGIRDEAGLELICHKVRDKKYSTLFDKASFLLYTIATEHPFFNGNKRTALAATLSFLVLNGSDIGIVEHYNNAETMEFMLEVAKYKKSRKDVRDFLEEKFKS